MQKAELTYDFELIDNILNNYKRSQNKFAQDQVIDDDNDCADQDVAGYSDIDKPIPAKISKRDFYNMLKYHDPNKKSTFKSQKKKKKRKVSKTSKRINRKK